MKILLRSPVLDYFLIQPCNMTGLLANLGDVFGTGADKHHCSCCQGSGWEHEGDAESLLPAWDCHHSVLLPSVSGVLSSAPVQEATCVHCCLCQQSRTSRNCAVGTHLSARTRGSCGLPATNLRL